MRLSRLANTISESPTLKLSAEAGRLRDQGQPVINLVFQFGIGVDPEPFLQQQAFEQQQWWIGVSTFAAGATATTIVYTSVPLCERHCIFAHGERLPAQFR